MLTVRLSPKLEARLNKLAKRTGRPKAYYAKRAIAEFLDEQEDYLIAVARLEDELPPIPLSKVVKRLGLDRRV
ncbi:MAG TPA: ribbon-helix-helix protein, CopG family [Terriglobales bacterium]|nr:ribbon-helix-helix protein, CopG family [Terriglobales bacterium]